MHALGLVLFWAAIQVTVILLAILMLLRLMKNSAPASRIPIVLAGMFSALLMSAFAVSPWPSWPELFEPDSAVANEVQTASDPVTDVGEVQTASAHEASLANRERQQQTLKTEDGSLSVWSAAWAAFVDELSVRPAPKPSPKIAAEEDHFAWTIPSIVAIVFLAGVSFGLLRLVLGMVLLRREVRRSRVIDEERITQAIGEILPASKTTQAIEVRVTHKLQTAATTGIFRPVVLLPANWPKWTDEELRAVLAHELNHIRRRDCITALFAEVGRVLHFYHPLMHWLANRLRLEQELAADAVAARHIGGQRRYLCILAEMALSDSSRGPAWPARAFLPSHRTFMRRIEMLKKKPLEESRPSRFRQFGTLALIGLATLFAVGLRSRSHSAIAQEPDAKKPDAKVLAKPEPQENRETAPQPPKAFPLTYVPDDAVAVFGVRPKALLAKPMLEPLAKVLLQEKNLAKPMGIPLDQIEEVVWSFGLWSGTGGTPEPKLIAGMVRTSDKLNLETLKQQLTPDSETGFYGGQLYLKQPGGKGPAFWLADEYTVIASETEQGLKKAIDARNTSANSQKRIPVWDMVSKQTAAAYINVRQFRNLMGMYMNRTMGDMGDRDEIGAGGRGGDGMPGGGFGGGRPMTPQERFRQSFGLNTMFGPLWNDVDSVVGGLEVEQGMTAHIILHANDTKDGKYVHPSGRHVERDDGPRPQHGRAKPANDRPASPGQTTTGGHVAKAGPGSFENSQDRTQGFGRERCTWNCRRKRRACSWLRWCRPSIPPAMPPSARNRSTTSNISGWRCTTSTTFITDFPEHRTRWKARGHGAERKSIPSVGGWRSCHCSTKWNSTRNTTSMNPGTASTTRH